MRDELYVPVSTTELEQSPRNGVERALVFPAIGTVVGCWLGIIPIALDWDRPWQVRVNVAADYHRRMRMT